MAFLFRLFVYHRQFRAVAWCHLCRFNQNRLQMLVALFREWRALGDIGRTTLRAAQSAVADGLLDRGKSLHVANFQRVSIINYFSRVDKHWIVDEVVARLRDRLLLDTGHASVVMPATPSKPSKVVSGPLVGTETRPADGDAMAAELLGHASRAVSEINTGLEACGQQIRAER
jgi:lysozyme family protein